MNRFLIAMVIAMALPAIPAEAQLVKGGGGISWGSGIYFRQEDHTYLDISHKSANPALTLKGIYRITLPLQISPSVTLFMPRVTDHGYARQTMSAFLFDVNAHYVVNSLDRFEFYGLGGGKPVGTENEMEI